MSPFATTSREPPLPDDAPMGMDPLLDSAPAGFLTVDASGTVRQANATIAAMAGRRRGELVGRHIDELLAPPGRIFFSTHVFPLLRVQGLAEEIYLAMRSADDSEVPMLLNGRARDAEGELLFDLVVVPMRQRNVLETELIAARNAAQEAVAAKDRFVSILTHELRSPLTGVIGYADLLLRGSRGPLTEGQQAYVQRIRDAADYQVTLIDDILDFTAAGSDRQLVAGALPLEGVLQRAESILAVRASEEGRPLERSPRPAPGSVAGDGAAIQQILLNLGTNALKYGRVGTPIRIKVHEAEGRVRISVSDEGDGIPPDQLERIFEPFVRLVPSEDQARGIGLGLAISRDLARGMGGDITVTSTPGTGSTFVLDLPAA